MPTASVVFRNPGPTLPSPFFPAGTHGDLALFLFLAVDEGFEIHESIGAALKQVEWAPRFRGGHGLWVVPYLLVGLLVAVLGHRELLSLWRTSKRESVILVGGFATFMAGVVGVVWVLTRGGTLS